MVCGPTKVSRSTLWSPPPLGMLKFNVDKWEVLFMFSKFVGICDSIEVEMRAILEALWCLSRSFHGSLIVDSDSSNVVSRVSNRKANPWKFKFLFNEFCALSSSINFVFHYESRSTSSMVDAFAKQGV
eukprot:TRINITY_DN9843_c0_g3_i1.p1 TRINITY_DN9843_c0_g3~~TRINITY_DN9843_c0_g3_i1.p1  ORF type:complete len:128 (-),score=12.55 TRINITY_DN9843_c0_g3_i1:1054-1437(-)